MSESQISENNKAAKSAAKPREEPHELEVLADKANKLSPEELEEIFQEHLPAPKTADELEKEENRTWSFTDGPTLKSTPDLDQKVWNLFEENMRDIYIQANDPYIRWNPAQKRRELHHTKARFVLLQTPDTLEAFCSFRLGAWKDENKQMRFVLYIYEIQVAKEQRGTGIFRRILTALEGMGAELGVQVIRLTCFTCNVQALPVYAHLGFIGIESMSETSQEFWKPVSQTEWSTA